jgi:hypothetical protein
MSDTDKLARVVAAADDIARRMSSDRSLRIVDATTTLINTRPRPHAPDILRLAVQLIQRDPRYADTNKQDIRLSQQQN